MDDFKKRDLGMIAAGSIVVTVLLVVAAWWLLWLHAPSYAHDPLAKSGGLKPIEDIRKLK